MKVFFTAGILTRNFQITLSGQDNYWTQKVYFLFSQPVTNPLFPDHAKAPTFQIMSRLLRNMRFDIPR